MPSLRVSQRLNLGLGTADEAARIVSPERELARLDEHFRTVLSRLHAQAPARLGRSQRRSRARRLAELEHYARRRRFPRNTRYQALRLPHFVDERGTRCAMADLIERSGGADLVGYIAAARNLDRIDALADLPELLDWLERNGLTVDEARQIQPEYCFYPAEACVCYLAGPTTTWLEGSLAETDAGFQLVVNAVYGFDHTVMPGDTVAVSLDPLNDWPHVLASWNDPEAIVRFRFGDYEKAYPTSGCTGSSGLGTAPTGLPKDVLVEALTGYGCESVLAAYNPAWGEASCPAQSSAASSAASSGSGGTSEEASPNTVQHSDGGCSAGPGNADGAVGVLIAGACVLRACVRARRQP